MLRYLRAHMEIQYDGETDAEYRRRVEHMEAHNAAVDRELAAWAPSPMKGLRPDWDCGCWFSCKIHTGEWHPFCPRRE